LRRVFRWWEVGVHRFGDLEAVVMDRLWDREGTTTVRDLVDALQTEREIAYTTVMTTMDNLHRKGWLERHRRGKAYDYWPRWSREEYTARLMREALSVGGNSGVVFTHLVEQMTDVESARLREALARMTTQPGESGD
jgi:predicted transcriptional regulator